MISSSVMTVKPLRLRGFESICIFVGELVFLFTSAAYLFALVFVSGCFLNLSRNQKYRIGHCPKIRDELGIIIA